MRAQGGWVETTRLRVRQSKRSSGVEWRSHGVSAKGGRICWDVASGRRSQKERTGGEGSDGRVLEGRDSG